MIYLTTFRTQQRHPAFCTWVGSDTDWGTAIGRFYSFAPHLCCWTWCYLIWLSKDSPSAAWISADIAWEQDLENGWNETSYPRPYKSVVVN
ncbi:MAG: hypothetical protein AB3A66_15670 [Nodularia sp. CChRGM 3473]